MRQKVEVISAVHSPQGRVQRQVASWLLQAAHRPTRQFVQHMLQAFRHLVAIDQAASEHFLATGVLGVAGVVEDFHGGKATEFLKMVVQTEGEKEVQRQVDPHDHTGLGESVSPAHWH